MAKKKPLKDVSVLELRSIIKSSGISITFVAEYIRCNRSNLSNYLSSNYLPPSFRERVEQFINDKNLY